MQMERAGYAALAEIAAERGVSIGSLIRNAIRAYLARQRKG